MNREISSFDSCVRIDEIIVLFSPGIVIYTGTECRAAMNNSHPRSKVGLIDMELNGVTKVLFIATVFLAVLMVVLKGFDGPWYIFMFRFVLLFSYLIPISLRVNLELAKIFYAWAIGRDKDIPGTQARSTTIPEELGRVSYLLSDKTGTLTMNQMIFKKLHLGSAAYSDDTFDEVKYFLFTFIELSDNTGLSSKDETVKTT